nr:MAG: hypothetical protein [Bacteriophage sp.]
MYPVHEVRLHDVEPGIAVSVLIGGAVIDDVSPKSIYSLALCICVPDAKHGHLELVEHGSHSLVALRVDRVLQRELPIALVLDGHNSVEVDLDGAAVLRDIDLEHLRRCSGSKRNRCIGDRSVEVLDLCKGENVSPRCRVALADTVVCHIVNGITDVDHGLRLVDVRAGSLGILTSEHHALLKVLIGQRCKLGHILDRAERVALDVPVRSFAIREQVAENVHLLVVVLQRKAAPADGLRVHVACTIAHGYRESAGDTDGHVRRIKIHDGSFATPQAGTPEGVIFIRGDNVELLASD